MRIVRAAALLASLIAAAWCQNDWPMYGHDPGGMRYSPLKQINPKNIAKLQLSWTYDTEVKSAAVPAPVPAAGEVESAGGVAGRAGARRGRGPRRTEMTPLVVGGIMYLGTSYGRVLALEPETGAKLWEFESTHMPAERGIAYWPGDQQRPPQVVVTTMDGWLFCLNAKTGKLVPGFGDEGMVNMRQGVADKFPNAFFGLGSPAAVYKDILITGSHVQEGPVLGPSGDVRAWDARTGKQLWTFHTIPRPGEANHDVWEGDSWVDRSGANSWGLITVDVQHGMVFLPVGAPTVDFYGGDRKGSNLYGSSVVALDAVTGKLKWYFQTTHHDNWDYDVSAAPALIEVTRNGKKIPAVAVSTKQALLFILDRMTGKPIYPVEERPVAIDNTAPGDEPWPTQPFPVKPPPLSRTAFKPEEVAKVTPEHEKYCTALLAMEGGAMTGGPYAQYGPKLRVIFPSWVGGGNWGGMSFDPTLGYLFVNTQDLANFNKLVKRPDGSGYARVGPDSPPENLGGMFWDGNKIWPCQQPPWGELTAVNVNTGEIAWKVPLGSYEELDKQGVPKTGTPNKGGSIVTAGGLVFIGASMDKTFHAFEAKTGKEIWSAKLNASGHSVPITYLGKDGKQYVAIMAGGGHNSEPASPGRLHVYALQ